MNSFIGWIGGKKLLREEILKRFPDEFERYIEVFGGAGWVLFYKDRHAQMEVYNDFNSDLVNLFKCVKYHCQELQRELSYILNSRELFSEFTAHYNVKGMTDIQRAARFFMLIKTSYGSTGRTYGCCKKDVGVMIKYLDQIQQRLSAVIIENKHYSDVLKTYDRAGALFYLDPPYYGTEKYYSAEFTQADHEQLASMLKTLKGKFILSYNNCDFIKNLYKKYTIEEVSRSHNLTARYAHSENRYQELIIRNF